MPDSLKISNDLSVPANAMMQTWAFIGRKGSGKTYAAGRLAELFLDDGAQVVVLDPVGNWYGLRLDRSGKKSSRLAIPILGGEHGDIPLEPSAGTLIAKWLVDTGSSAVLDVSGFHKGKRKTFVADFAEELYRLKAADRSPLHLVIEEAQVFAPQRSHGDERMLGAIEDIVRIGRNRGIGCSLISQRPQSINKEVLNQAEPLVVFQLAAKHERDAIKGWMEHVGEDLLPMLADLPKLETGDCYLWSPAWIREFRKIRFTSKLTYDASATPEVGIEAVNPKQLKPADLHHLQQQLAEVLEAAGDSDPKQLRAEVKRLKDQLATAQSQVEFERNSVDRVAKLKAGAIQDRFDAQQQKVKLLRDLLLQVTEAVDLLLCEPDPKAEPPKPQQPKRNEGSRSPHNDRTPVTAKLPKGESIILTAIAQHAAGVDREQLSVLTAYKRSSRDTYLQRLREKGLIDTDGELITATVAGFAVLGKDFEPLPTGAELRAYWLGKLPEGERRILELLIDAYPDPVRRDDLSDATGYKRSSRDTYLQRLKSRKLIRSTGNREVLASRVLCGE